MKRYLALIVIGLLVSVIISFIFVTLWTPAAAEITDKYLRPVFGDRQIVFLEKIFLNLSDNTSKVIYDFKKPIAPRFTTSSADAGMSTSLDLRPIAPNPAFSALSGEGVWHSIPLAIFPNREVMARTFVRPDSSRSFAIVSIVKMDMSALTIGSVAGTVEPGGKVGKYGPGRVPEAIVQRCNLVAAFDGGFQYRDGAYGMIVGKTTYLPLQCGLGTVAGYSDGSVKILEYTGQPLGNDATFVRQNGPMLIKDAHVAVTNPDSQQVWGRVVGDGAFTWRSGIGIAAKGELIFAAGNNLSPQTLALALSAAGADNAIQLDINPHWVRFNLFNANGDSGYDSAPLNPDMQDGAREYLNGYQKDFFYIYKRQSAP